MIKKMKGLIYGLPIKEAIHIVELYQAKQLIPVDWIKRKKEINVHEKYDYVRGCFDGFNDCIDYLIDEWKEENEQAN